MYICITLTDLLDKWEAPPINQVSKELEKLQKVIKQQEATHNEFRYVPNHAIHVCILYCRMTMMEALNEQKQLIRELISKQDNQTQN